MPRYASPDSAPSIIAFDELENGTTLYYACSTANPKLCTISNSAQEAQDALNERAQYGMPRYPDADQPGAVEVTPQYVADNGTRIFAAVTILAILVIVAYLRGAL